MSKDLSIMPLFFKAIASEIRLKMIGLLAARPYTIEELSEALQLKENKVLHNLDRLNELDLVEILQEGNKRHYSMNVSTLMQIKKKGMEVQEGERISNEQEGWEEKVLRNYITDNQLLSIPAQRKKRDVILNWLVTKFEKGVNYPEKQVNDVLAQYHPDVATLRREFIMTRLMKREDAGGHYWRV